MEYNSELSAERRAQVDCVLRILSHFIEKLKIALIIPCTLLNADANILLEGITVEAQKNILQKCLKNLKTNTYLNENILALFQSVDDQLGKTDSWSKYLSRLSSEDESLLKSFKLLYGSTQERLSKSALSDLSKDRELYRLQRRIGNLEKSITEFSEKLRTERISRRWKLGMKAGLIQKYEEDLAFQKWDNNMRIKQEIVRSCNNIQSLQESCNERLLGLENEAGEKQIVYTTLLRENLMLEKDGRAEKNKLLFQLQSYLKKYDQNVGEKIKENLELQKDYDEKKAKFDEFKTEYLRQEAEYKAIMQQKEKEEQFLFEQRLMVFMMGRAARTIQVYWRKYRREQKKKSKKGKGKGKKK